MSATFPTGMVETDAYSGMLLPPLSGEPRLMCILVAAEWRLLG